MIHRVAVDMEESALVKINFTWHAWLLPGSRPFRPARGPQHMNDDTIAMHLPQFDIDKSTVLTIPEQLQYQGGVEYQVDSAGATVLHYDSRPLAKTDHLIGIHYYLQFITGLSPSSEYRNQK